MKKSTLILIFMLGMGLLSAMAQTKKLKTLHGHEFKGTSTSSSLLAFSKGTYGTFVQPETYTYLYINGRVGFGAKNAWLLTVKDTTKLSIKYADTIFILHISPKFVTKINDSTYTFKNQ